MSQREEFDAGNEFASTGAEAIAAALKGGDGEPEPQQPEAAAEGETESAEPDSEVRTSWEDQRPGVEEDEVAKASKAAPAVPTLEIKGNRGLQKFELSPDNPQLIKALQFGTVAPTWKRERDEARKALTAERERFKTREERAARVDEVEGLAQAGHIEQAARVALGETAFKTLVQQMVDEAVEYAEANPARRAEIDRAREGRYRAFDKWNAEREVQRSKSELETLRDQVETDKLTTFGTTALAQHSFKRSIKDSDIAHQMDQKLWKLAWADLEEMSEQGLDIDKAAVDRAFATNYKVLSSVIQKQTETKVTKILDTKKQDAKTKAQLVATERYPKASATDAGDWDGKSAKGLWRALRNRQG